MVLLSESKIKKIFDQNESIRSEPCGTVVSWLAKTHVSEKLLLKPKDIYLYVIIQRKFKNYCFLNEKYIGFNSFFSLK